MGDVTIAHFVSLHLSHLRKHLKAERDHFCSFVTQIGLNLRNLENLVMNNYTKMAIFTISCGKERKEVIRCSFLYLRTLFLNIFMYAYEISIIFVE